MTTPNFSPGYTGMQTNRYKHFRWNGRTAWVSIAYMVIFPSLIGYIAYKTDVRNLASFLFDIILWVVDWRTLGMGKLSLFQKRRGAEEWFD